MILRLFRRLDKVLLRKKSAKIFKQFPKTSKNIGAPGLVDTHIDKITPESSSSLEFGFGTYTGSDGNTSSSHQIFVC